MQENLIVTSQLLCLFFLTITTERITEILVASKLIQPWRDFLRDKSINSLKGYDKWWFLDSIFHCGYCMSVWISFLTAIIAPSLVSDDYLINYVVMVFSLHGLSNLYHVFFEYARRGRANYYEVNMGYKRIKEDG